MQHPVLQERRVNAAVRRDGLVFLEEVLCTFLDAHAVDIVLDELVVSSNGDISTLLQDRAAMQDICLRVIQERKLCLYGRLIAFSNI